MAYQSIEEWWQRETERCKPEWDRDYWAAAEWERGQWKGVRGKHDALAAATRSAYAAGLMHLRGEGVPHDYERAARCFFQAACCPWDASARPFGPQRREDGPGRAQARPYGHAGARFFLGMMCASGLGVPKSPEMAAFCWANALGLEHDGNAKDPGMSRVMRCLMLLPIVVGIVLAVIGAGCALYAAFHFIVPLLRNEEAARAEAFRQGLEALDSHDRKVRLIAGLLGVVTGPVAFVLAAVLPMIHDDFKKDPLLAFARLFKRVISGCLACCLFALRAWWGLLSILSCGPAARPPEQ